jgi:hypothetical protein
VGIAHVGGTLSVAGIVRDILEDRSCRRLGTAVGASKFQRAMVTDRMLIDAARQLARQASDNPLDFRYGLCVFGLMPAQSAPGAAWAEFVRMCKAFSVAQHVLEADSIARINTIQATTAYGRAHVMYGHVRAQHPLETMIAVQNGLLAIASPQAWRYPGVEQNVDHHLGPHDTTRLLPADEHRIEFLRHVFYLKIASVAPNGLLTDEGLSKASDLVHYTCDKFYSNSLLKRSDAGQRELILAILRRVPQLYTALWDTVHRSTWNGGDFKVRALKTVFEAYRRPVEDKHFSHRYAQWMRVSARCNAAFMRSRGATVELATTWSGVEQGSYMDHMIELPQSRIASLLKIFPNALVDVNEFHLYTWDRERIDKLKTVLAKNPQLKRYVIIDASRQRLGLVTP